MRRKEGEHESMCHIKHQGQTSICYAWRSVSLWVIDGAMKQLWWARGRSWPIFGRSGTRLGADVSESHWAGQGPLLLLTEKERQTSAVIIWGSEQRSYVGHKCQKYISSLTSIISKLEIQKKDKLQETPAATGSWEKKYKIKPDQDDHKKTVKERLTEDKQMTVAPTWDTTAQLCNSQPSRTISWFPS